MTAVNPGPAASGVPNTSAQLGIKGRPFRGVVTSVLSGTVDNWVPTGWVINYSDAVYIVLNGASPTLNGFSALGFHQGDRVQLWNSDTAGIITINHKASTSYAQNQFWLNSGAFVTLPPTTGAVMTYSGSYWFFS